jgi:hypothetical protein
VRFGFPFRDKPAPLNFSVRPIEDNRTPMGKMPRGGIRDMFRRQTAKSAVVMNSLWVWRL